MMSLDLEERLAAYRPTLESAIEGRAAGSEDGRPPSRRRTWIVTAMAAAAVAAGVVGLVVVRPASTPDSQAPADGPVPDPPPDFTPTTVPIASTVVVTAPPAPTGSTQPDVTVASPVATTAVATRPGSVIAIGDSVMLGAAGELAQRGIVVSADESRQIVDTVEFMEQLRDNGQLGDAVVVHLGTNGPPSPAVLDEFFAPLAGVPKVIVLTAYVDRSWTSETNANLSAVPQRFPNVQILDWAVLAEQCPGDCFWDDGYHLGPDGRTYYTDLIIDALEP